MYADVYCNISVHTRFAENTGVSEHTLAREHVSSRRCASRSVLTRVAYAFVNVWNSCAHTPYVNRSCNTPMSIIYHLDVTLCTYISLARNVHNATIIITKTYNAVAKHLSNIKHNNVHHEYPYRGQTHLFI